MNNSFRRFAHWTSELVGSPWAFTAGLAITMIWAATGPMFHFSDTWQLVINTGTTVVTFLMVFLIQNTQNRDAKAIHLKLDELIRAVGAARTRLVHLENLTDDELASLEQEFQKLQEKTQKKQPLPDK
jgi:low affinity Fe/Cu permease